MYLLVHAHFKALTLKSVPFGSVRACVRRITQIMFCGWGTVLILALFTANCGQAGSVFITPAVSSPRLSCVSFCFCAGFRTRPSRLTMSFDEGRTDLTDAGADYRKDPRRKLLPRGVLTPLAPRPCGCPHRRARARRDRPDGRSPRWRGSGEW